MHLSSYSLHINLYDLFFIGTMSIMLNFALQLWFGKSLIRAANRVLALALTATVSWIGWKLAADMRYLLPLQVSMAIGPLLYFYVLKRTNHAHQFRRSDLLHFIPVLLQQAFLSWNKGWQVLTLVWIVFYIFKSLKLIQDFYKVLPLVRMDRTISALRWLKRILEIISLLCMVWLVDGLFNLGGDSFFHLAFSLFMIWAGAAAFFKSQPEEDIHKSTPKTLAPAALKEKGRWLKKAVETGLYFQDPELTLASMAHKLGLHPHELSRILNAVHNKSFYDFINEYRVRDVARKIQDPAYNHLTLLGIAYEAGFNSQSSFTRIFKLTTGKTPLEYKKECSTYKLGSFRSPAPIILSPDTTPKWSQEKLNGNYMICNYFKTAYRNLVKNKGFSALNIAGLSVGLAACLLIGLYVLDELSYDRYNENANRIYRVNEDIRFAGNATAYAQSPAPLAGVLKANFPIIEQSVRIKSTGTMIVKKDNQELRQESVAYADPTVFSVFTLPLLSGHTEDALKEPNCVVISQTAALKYFGTTDAAGRLLVFNQNDNYRVTAVMRDMPLRSHFRFDMLLSMASLPDSRSDVWLSNDYNTYVLLRNDSDAEKLDAALPGVMRRYIGPQLQNAAHISIADFEKGGNYFRLSLMPLTAIHLVSNRTGELGHNGDKQYVYLFFFISLFILVIACINFINLSTAKSAGRAKEVGIRKVLGSARSALVAQFLSESILLVFTAMMIAIAMALVCLPMFNSLAGKAIAFGGSDWPWLFFVSILISIVVGLAAGAYPALFLSGFQPILVLKGKLSAGFKSSWLRNSLVVFQFSVAVLLIVATLVVNEQLQYIRHRDLGFDRDHVIIIENTGDLGKNAEVLRRGVASLPDVVNATLTGYLPTSEARNSSALFQTQDMDQKKAIQSQTWTVDGNYLPAMGMHLAAGRNFSPDFGTDSTAMIVNESAAKAMGTAQVLNKTLYYPLADSKTLKAFHIIGVVKDFNFSSLKAGITPVVLTLGSDHGALSVRIKGDVSSILVAIREKWSNLSGGRTFEYSFMDQQFDNLYRTEQRTGGVFIALTVLAILIACLGLFGLAAYGAEQQFKEIGIRKVLGASTIAITRMLSVDFIRLVGIAILIAAPLSWYLMYNWLQTFAYRVPLHWWLIAFASLGAILVALATVSIQAVKSALTNPVKSLKSE